MKNESSRTFLFANALSNDDVGGGKGHRIEEDTSVRELVSNPSISMKKSWGGLP